MDYLISLHFDLPPYNRMTRIEALKAIKLHCGIPTDYISKYEMSKDCDVVSSYDSDFTKHLLLEQTSYANIKTLSEEEDVLSGSEEFYIDKWKIRPPYNTMPDAETVIRSKLNIVHRDTL